MTTSSSTSKSGIGFVGLLTIVFVIAKIAQWGEVATWSWWWVFSPVWLVAGFVCIILLFALLFAIIAAPTKRR